MQIKTRDWLWNLILGSCLLCTGRRTLCIVSDIFIDDISCSAGRAWCVKCIEPLHGLWIRQPNTDTSHHHWGLRVEEWLAWIWVSGTSGSNQWSITTLTLISIKNIYKLKLHFPFLTTFWHNLKPQNWVKLRLNNFEQNLWNFHIKDSSFDRNDWSTGVTTW